MKVKYHNHVTEQYQGFAHLRIFDLNVSKKVPVVFHDLENYNSHLIFQEIGKHHFKINVIEKTIEKYMSFAIQQRC